jgi:hypothetical protein
LFEAVELALTQSFIDQDITQSLMSTVSLIFKHFHGHHNETKSISDRTLPLLKPANGVIIDPNYCDNEKFSDIQFLVEDKQVYAHRIIISSYPKFEASLQNFNNNPVRISDINYDVFKVG